MAMFEDDQPKLPVHEIGSDLSLLSADELSARIALLQAEIERIEEERRRKTDSRQAAERFFRQ